MVYQQCIPCAAFSKLQQCQEIPTRNTRHREREQKTKHMDILPSVNTRLRLEISNPEQIVIKQIGVPELPEQKWSWIGHVLPTGQDVHASRTGKA